MPEELLRALDRQQNEIVNRQPWQMHEVRLVDRYAARPEPRTSIDDPIAVCFCAEPPQERLGLESRAAAGIARRVSAILGQQHADVHLVRLALEPGEEALDAIPRSRPRLRPAHPFRLAVQDPAARALVQLAPWNIERDAALFRV